MKVKRKTFMKEQQLLFLSTLARTIVSLHLGAILAGLEEMKDGGTGEQLYATSLRIIDKAGIKPQFIVSVSTVGPPFQVIHERHFRY
ncbi:hypothetical protein BLNAU_14372 [Blattamonas nauphoetae]|uniref:Uncharacterized protein n=1 Tax=Blattamonas nauphoetae TaxID=2049346 RepID=A0ABQ9XFH8_9EUKA|nr:hypothetical protein BLNAU_14372 [Blattamonas nauphoetae]